MPAPGDSVRLPDFCSGVVLLQALLWGQIGAMVYMLGGGLPLDWNRTGLVSVYTAWLTLIIVFAWCLLGRLATGGDPGPRKLNLLWAALWPAAVVTASALAALISLLGGSRFLPLLPAGVAPWSFITTTALLSAILGGSLLRYLYMQGRWRDQQLRQARAELRNLQARVQPHFLFNTMNSIAALIDAHPRAAIEAIEDLSDLLRQSLRPGAGLIELADEIQLARRYLRLMQWRLGERLRVDWHITPAIEQDRRWRLPPMTLQVLLENAVLHGIQPNPEGGVVTVQAAAQGRRLELRISNPMPPAGKGHSGNGDGTGTATADLRRRLALMYAEPVTLTTGVSDSTFTARLLLPAVSRPATGAPP